MTWAGARMTDVGPPTTTLSTGAWAADGVTALDGAEGALGPAASTARTVNVYVVPFVRPPTRAVAVFNPTPGGGMLTVIPEGFAVTV